MLWCSGGGGAELSHLPGWVIRHCSRDCALQRHSVVVVAEAGSRRTTTTTAAATTTGVVAARCLPESVQLSSHFIQREHVVINVVTPSFDRMLIGISTRGGCGGITTGGCWDEGRCLVFDLCYQCINTILKLRKQRGPFES